MCIGIDTQTLSEHSLHHTLKEKGQKGMVGGHQCMDVRFEQSVSRGVCACTVCVCVFECPGAWSWESGGVQKAFIFFCRWIERTALTNGLFSAQDSDFTSFLYCNSRLCPSCPEPFGPQSIASIQRLNKKGFTSVPPHDPHNSFK